MLEKIGSSIDRQSLRRYLAEYMLSLKEGDALSSVRELARQYKTSVGSISNVIHDLEELNAVTIARRGAAGSFLDQKSTHILWDASVNGPMVIALPLPSYPKCEGLATALYGSLNNAGIETYLIFIRGSYNRIKALREGRCHATVMSVLAADQLCETTEQVVFELPGESFLSDHRVFYRKGLDFSGPQIRVAIDKDSFDIKYLTELEFANADAVYQEVTLMQIGRHLARGLVDAAIWNIDHMEAFLNENILSRPLSPEVRAVIGDRDTSTAVVIRADDKPSEYVLKELLVKQEILDIQEQVVSGEVVARY